jgi:hypothetical protein
MTAYSELLRHPRWQQKRLGVMARDEWKCVKCGETERDLQVHHLYYLPDHLPWEYPDDAFVTYCELCHEKVEFMKWVIRAGQLELKKQGFPISDMKEVVDLVSRKVMQNHHAESARQYMHDIRTLLNG